MKLRAASHGFSLAPTRPEVGNFPPARPRAGERASVLIIVLWVAIGLVTIALYFANSMSLELRAADNRVAGTEAEQAIEGAVRYLTNILAQAQEPGRLPDPQSYRSAKVSVGAATFWLIGRDTNAWQTGPDLPVFGLVDEASKLNLNTATLEMLEALPRMTPELAAAIIDWRDSDSNVTSGGAEDETYQRHNPAYRCKNANFETVEELRLVSGAYLEILFGEDANLNGVLDANENDADLSAPFDNRDSHLDPGIFEYLTVFTREPATRTNGSPRVSVSGGIQQLPPILQEKLGAARANAITRRLRNARFGSVLEFYLGSGMTAEEFAQIEADIANPTVEGLVNVNTASEAVLSCIPGIGTENASLLVSFRTSNPDKLASVAWVTEVLERNRAIQAGRYITSRGYQFTADVGAVGRFGRGYRRVKFILDTSAGTPKVVSRQDLTHLGWALGKNARNTLLLANQTR